MAGQHLFVGLSCLSPGTTGWEIASTFYNGVYAVENQIGLFTTLPADISPSTLPYKLGYDGACTESRKPDPLSPVNVDRTMRSDVCGFDFIHWNFPTDPASILGNKIQGQTYDIVTLPPTTCETTGSTLTLYVGSHFSTYNVPDSSGSLTSQTAWSHTKPPTSGNWGAYSSVTFTCDARPTGDPPIVDDGDYTCETVFAQSAGSQCFLDLDLGISRWGWTTATDAVPIAFDLWGGAAHCDTTKAKHAGTAEIRSDGSVVYNLADGVIMTEYHVYVGATPVPEFSRGKKSTFSVAPGQYTFKATSLNDSADLMDVFNNPWSGVTVLDGVSVNAYPSYVILHAVACSKSWV